MDNEKIENQWVSWERDLYICSCKNVKAPEQEIMINLKFSKSDQIINLESIIKTTMIKKVVECSQCKNIIQVAPLIKYSNHAIIINLEYEEKNYQKINLSLVPKKIVLNDSNYVLKIIIAKEDDVYKTFYRIRRSKFLEIENKVRLEYVHEKCNEEVNIDMMIYIRSDEVETDEKPIMPNHEILKPETRIFHSNELDKDINKNEVIEIAKTNTLKINPQPLKLMLLKEKTKKLSIFDSMRESGKLIDGFKKNVPFPNCFQAQFNRETINFKLMCPYNSVFSVFSALFNYTDLFKNHLNEFSSEIPFFKFILEVKANLENNNYDRNQKWIDLINEHFPGRIQSLRQFDNFENMFSCLMDWEVFNVFEFNNDSGFFRNWENTSIKQYFCVKAETVQCNNKNCTGHSENFERFIHNFTIPKESLMLNRTLANFLLAGLRGTDLNCTVCKKLLLKEPIFTFPDCLILGTSLMQKEYFELESIDLNKITKTLTLNNNSYVLKGIINTQRGHFKSFFRIEGSKFIEMDDLKYPQGSRKINYPLPCNSEPILINPTILIYIKDNEIINDDPIHEIIETEFENSKLKTKDSTEYLMDISDDQPLDMSYSSISDEDEAIEIDINNETIDLTEVMDITEN
jgi:hypothetical protein